MELSLKRIILAVLILYGVIFLLFLNDYNGIFLFHADSHEYVTLGQNLLEHHVFSRDLRTPEVIRIPGYPFFIALTMAVAGERHFQYLVVLLQILMVGGTACIIYLLGQRLFGNHKLGLVAASAYVLIPTTIFYACVGMTETLFTFLLALAIYLLSAKSLSNPKAFLIGVVVALAILVRPIAMLSPIILLPMAMRTRWRAGIWFLLALILALTPWLVRNHDLSYGLTISSIGDLNLAHGNAAKFYAWQNHISPADALVLVDQRAEDKIARQPSLTEAQAHKEVALEVILPNLPAYTVFHLTKTLPFYLASSIKGVALNLQLTKPGQRTADLLLKGDWLGVSKKLLQEAPYSVESVLRALMAVLVFIGGWQAWKKKDVFLFLLFLLIVLFSLLSSPWSEARFRTPIEPYMLLLALSVLNFRQVTIVKNWLRAYVR